MRTMTPFRLKFAAFWIVAALLVAIVAGGCGGGVDEDQLRASILAELQQSVRTQQLQIVSEDGTVRAELATLEDGRPGLSLLDMDGTSRAVLFIGTNGVPNLVLIGSPRLALMDGAGEIRAALRLDGTGAPAFSQMDGTGQLRYLVSQEEDGTSLVELYGSDGEPEWTAP